MRIVFMGTPFFALPTLSKLLSSHHEVVAVVTTPDKPAGRSLRISPSPVKEFAQANALPIFQPDEMKDPEFIDELTRLDLDLGVVVAFRILPEEVFTIPKTGCVNLHPSLLPDLRGAAPINWALIRGYTHTGVSTFFIERRVDSGNLLMQEEVEIFPEDDVGSLSDRLSELGAELILRTVNGIAEGSIVPIQQKGSVTVAPKITKELGKIDWAKSAEEIANLVRGLSPAPAAYTIYNNGILKIFRTKSVLSPNLSGVGEVLIEKDRIIVQAGNGGLELLELQVSGKKRMSSGELVRGRHLETGTILGE